MNTFIVVSFVHPKIKILIQLWHENSVTSDFKVGVLHMQIAIYTIQNSSDVYTSYSKPIFLLYSIQ
jgi:hypothetical protein